MRKGALHTGYAACDALIQDAQQAANPAARFVAMHRAEERLMADMPIMPLYDYVRLYLQNDAVSGIYFNPWGGLELKYAHVK